MRAPLELGAGAIVDRDAVGEVRRHRSLGADSGEDAIELDADQRVAGLDRHALERWRRHRRELRVGLIAAGDGPARGEIERHRAEREGVERDRIERQRRDADAIAPGGRADVDVGDVEPAAVVEPAHDREAPVLLLERAAALFGARVLDPEGERDDAVALGREQTRHRELGLEADAAGRGIDQAGRDQAEQIEDLELDAPAGAGVRRAGGDQVAIGQPRQDPDAALLRDAHVEEPDRPRAERGSFARRPDRRVAPMADVAVDLHEITVDPDQRA